MIALLLLLLLPGRDAPWLSLVWQMECRTSGTDPTSKRNAAYCAEGGDENSAQDSLRRLVSLDSVMGLFR